MSDSTGNNTDDSTGDNDDRYFKIDGLIALVWWVLLVVSLHTSFLPRGIEVLVIGSALAYMFILSLMLLFHSTGLVSFLMSE